MPELELYQLQNLLTASSEIAVQRVLVKLGLLKPSLSKSEAYNQYGRGTVDRWIREGLIKPNKDGNHSSKIRIDRIQLEILEKTSNRHTYLPSNEKALKQ
jgi:hypothetical protein